MANSGENNPMYAKTHTSVAREKIALARKGRTPTKNKVYTDTQRKNISEAVKAIAKIKCIHCGSMSSPGNHSRWHGDNCKSKLQ